MSNQDEQERAYMAQQDFETIVSQRERLNTAADTIATLTRERDEAVAKEADTRDSRDQIYSEKVAAEAPAARLEEALAGALVGATGAVSGAPAMEPRWMGGPDVDDDVTELEETVLVALENEGIDDGINQKIMVLVREGLVRKVEIENIDQEMADEIRAVLSPTETPVTRVERDQWPAVGRFNVLDDWWCVQPHCTTHGRMTCLTHAAPKECRASRRTGRDPKDDNTRNLRSIGDAWERRAALSKEAESVEEYPPTGLEPRGCPIPGACACPSPTADRTWDGVERRKLSGPSARSDRRKGA